MRNCAQTSEAKSWPAFFAIRCVQALLQTVVTRSPWVPIPPSAELAGFANCTVDQCFWVSTRRLFYRVATAPVLFHAQLTGLVSWSNQTAATSVRTSTNSTHIATRTPILAVLTKNNQGTDGNAWLTRSSCRSVVGSSQTCGYPLLWFFLGEPKLQPLSKAKKADESGSQSYVRPVQLPLWKYIDVFGLHYSKAQYVLPTVCMGVCGEVMTLLCFLGHWTFQLDF